MPKRTVYIPVKAEDLLNRLEQCKITPSQLFMRALIDWGESVLFPKPPPPMVQAMTPEAAYRHGLAVGALDARGRLKEELEEMKKDLIAYIHGKVGGFKP